MATHLFQLAQNNFIAILVIYYFERFHFQSHFEALNDVFFLGNLVCNMKLPSILCLKLISSMIPFERSIIWLKWRSYAKVTTPGS
jgi:hypothetical protein